MVAGAGDLAIRHLEQMPVTRQRYTAKIAMLGFGTALGHCCSPRPRGDEAWRRKMRTSISGKDGPPRRLKSCLSLMARPAIRASDCQLRRRKIRHVGMNRRTRCWIDPGRIPRVNVSFPAFAAAWFLLIQSEFFALDRARYMDWVWWFAHMVFPAGLPVRCHLAGDNR